MGLFSCFGFLAENCPAWIFREDGIKAILSGFLFRPLSHINILWKQDKICPVPSSYKQHLRCLTGFWMRLKLFHDGGRYHRETSPLICSANQWNGFYMITASVMKEINSWSFAKLWINTAITLLWDFRFKVPSCGVSVF